jgi:hypothetical protein
MKINTAASKAGISEPAAHMYLRLGKFPSELKAECRERLCAGANAQNSNGKCDEITD